ncbi:protein CHROMATIN REMODELING 4-like isoform X1 [Senna tora]|uniref:Protein CHROMATIN REMODELING 4-like isoform X1 n=1 Tax=Senna tora TaxID=362788 RepID=A0A834WVN7_9FABA|nr:protein CHROMATIN REMODELING 4-like isoform X1 [Senna tora]
MAMRGNTLRGGRAESSTKPSHSTFGAIPYLDEDDAAVPRTPVDTNHRELDSKGNKDNVMDEGSNRSPHDSLGGGYIFLDLLDRKICVSCNEGGEVLVCSERDCPITLHAKCFCIEPKFDDMGNFYCPYCCFKRALAEAQEFRKKAMTAKKDLCSFFRQNISTSDKMGQKDMETERKDLKELPVVGNGISLDHCNGQGNDSVHSQHLKKVRDQQNEMERVTTSANQHEIEVEDESHANPQKVNTSDSRPRHYREEKAPMRNGEDFDVHNISKTLKTRSNEGKEGIEPEDLRYDNETVYASIIKDAKPLSAFCFGGYTDVHSLDITLTRVKPGEKLSHNELKVSANGSSASESNASDSETLSMKKSHVEKGVQRPEYSRRVSSVSKSLLLKNDIEGKSACYKNEEFSGPYMQSCSKNLTSHSAKRKRLNWTTDEENTLKEGVLRFSVENRNIPWRKILEFGCDVFDNNRTPVDLKDKWKNMTSKEERMGRKDWKSGLVKLGFPCLVDGMGWRE